MLQTILEALVETRRREILGLVKYRELSAGEIFDYFAPYNVTRPAISQHIQVLEKAGLVSMRREGTRRLYQARPEGLSELKTFLEEYWDEGLELLKNLAETEERRMVSDDLAER